MDRNIYTDDGSVDTKKAPWSKFRKLPVIVEAIQMFTPFRVETKEGWVTGKKGDWLVRGIEGELYPCDNWVFMRTYELVEK